MSDAKNRDQRLAEVERAVRRGELREAIALCRQLLEQAPNDREVQARAAVIESLLQPYEGREPPAAPKAATPRQASSTPEQIAEELADHGDYAGAIATYERVLAERPDNQLARERCEELRALLGIRAAIGSATPPPVPGRARIDALAAMLKRIEARKRPLDKG